MAKNYINASETTTSGYRIRPKNEPVLPGIVESLNAKFGCDWFIRLDTRDPTDRQTDRHFLIYTHFYQFFLELQLIIFLHSNYYSNEATKTCIDNYYSVRALCPEFFAERNPTSKELKEAMKIVCICPLPKLTPNGDKILFSRLLDSNPDHYNFNIQMKLFDMATSLILAQEGTHEGHVLIVDLHGVVLGHLLRIGVMGMKKYMYFLQEALPVRLKGFHFINCVSFMDKIMALMKPFMKKELLDILFIHQGGMDSLFKTIPKDCLPNHIGGSAGPIEQFHGDLVQNMIENTNFFLNEEKEIADETKRQGKQKNAGDFFGVEGTFKKLDID